MLERLLRPFVDERVIFADDRLLVVDKPCGVPVHGGARERPDDLVTRLARFLEARGEQAYLGVHQRLDQEASGVLAFTRSRELNAAIAREIEARTARRRYVACVALPARGAASALSERGVLEHRIERGAGDRMRAVRTGGKVAVSEYRVLERAGARALLELSLVTGRTHQLRVQLAELGTPIAGDGLYGGPRAPRLLLHARELELASLGSRFAAPVPRVFCEWLRQAGAGLGDAEDLRRALLDAGSRRFSLLGHTDAFRLVNELGDQLPGVVIDAYGEFAVLAVSSDEARARAPEIAELLVEHGVRGVYLKVRVRGDLRRADAVALAPPQPIAGERAPDPLEVREGELRFGVSLGDGMSTGLFADQRENRDRIRGLARGKRVLNLFSYTCAFSVAAAHAGAAATVSVDLSSNALRRGRENLERNALSAERHRLLRADAVDWLARARRQRSKYDLIVLDPPTFATTGKKSTFRAEQAYQFLARDALSLLSPSGKLLAVTNHRGTSQAELRKILRQAAAETKVRITQLKDLPAVLDCPAVLGEPSPSRSVLVTVA